VNNFILKFVGILFVGLAVLGAVLPVLPTTPFLLVAAGCFAKSSPYLHGKLLQNKVFGPLIRDWQEYRTIPQTSKRISLFSMFLAGCWSCYMLDSMWIKLVVILLMVGPAIFVYRLPVSQNRSL